MTSEITLGEFDRLIADRFRSQELRTVEDALLSALTGKPTAHDIGLLRNTDADTVLDAVLAAIDRKLAVV
jgi:hypothetical protein